MKLVELDSCIANDGDSKIYEYNEKFQDLKRLHCAYDDQIIGKYVIVKDNDIMEINNQFEKFKNYLIKVRKDEPDSVIINTLKLYIRIVGPHNLFYPAVNDKPININEVRNGIYNNEQIDMVNRTIFSQVGEELAYVMGMFAMATLAYNCNITYDEMEELMVHGCINAYDDKVLLHKNMCIDTTGTLGLSVKAREISCKFIHGLMLLRNSKFD